MTTTASAAAPSWFRIVAVLAILWNLVGVYMYLHSVGTFGDPMADLTPEQRVAAESLPTYVTGAFAIGTFAGLLGSIGLLKGRRWALPVLVVSLVALAVLEGWIVFLSGHLDQFGLALPIIVTLGALLLVWAASVARRNGWLA